VSGLADFAWLFALSFGAASILPLASEPLLLALLVAGERPAWVLVLVAGLGNTLGSVANWAIGRQLSAYRSSRWFPVRPDPLARAERWYTTYGRPALLLAWVPIIGDVLTVAAGVLRERFWIFLPLVAVAKFGRYLVLAALSDALFRP
jgi:membrane protein YqaA with SNARE-associated domain